MSCWVDRPRPRVLSASRLGLAMRTGPGYANCAPLGHTALEDTVGIGDQINQKILDPLALANGLSDMAHFNDTPLARPSSFAWIRRFPTRSRPIRMFVFG